MIDSPLKGWAPVFGVYGVTWAAATIAVALNVLLMPACPKVAAAGAGRCGRIAIDPGAARTARLDARRRTPRWPSPPCRARCRRIRSGRPRIARDHGSAIPAHAQAWGARLIVWPESAMPVLANGITGLFAATCRSRDARTAPILPSARELQPETSAVLQRNAGIERFGERLVLQAALWCPSANISRAGVRALVDAADEPAV
jgi:apolipoprotein N-acyltransferase